MNHTPWKAERLAYWYFRLNGFLTTENFIVHPDRGRDQRTDADLLAVRFSNRAENLERPMEDDPRVASCNTLVNVVIAEVKTGPCALNGPWTDPESGNMQRVLKGIGCVSDSAIEQACTDLYSRGIWSSDSIVTIRLFAVGESRNPELMISQEQQITWGEIISFCIKRFNDYRYEKSSIGQWTADGIQLRRDTFCTEPEEHIRRSFGLRSDLIGGT